MVLSKLKIWSFAIMLLIGNTSLKAQTFSEFFRQKRTQEKYLMEQLVALKCYADYLKKGYNTAGEGLKTVRDFSNGEFMLHNSFISSLKKVSPVVRKNNRVAEIIFLQVEIDKAFKNVQKGNISNINYLADVKATVMDECEANLDELLLVITDGKAEMKDSERLGRLQKIYDDMLEKSVFVQHFCNQVNLLNRQRTRENQSVNDLKKLYGIN